MRGSQEVGSDWPSEKFFCVLKFLPGWGLWQNNERRRLRRGECGEKRLWCRPPSL